jgi:DNA-binding winged helix-turn-helix (wHTH) protein/tetratricopeptide (TPR) repeat protein
LKDTQPCIYDFGDFRIDTSKRLLLRSGDQVPLSPKGFDTLLLLIENRGKVLEKQHMLGAIWPDTAVEENNLNQNISTLRRIFGETRGENRYIATIPGKGYCFTADVRTAQFIASEGPATHIIIAVLPFENLSADPEWEYLADGLTEETIAAIGQIDPDHFSVIGRTSVMSYKRTHKTLAEIGQELDASYLVESSLRSEGDRFRIISKLIRVRDQLQIWSASYDSEPSSFLSFQRELSIAIAQQVRLRLSPARLTALANRQTQNPEAYDLYLRGRFFWNQFTPLTTRRAIEYFTQATALDPDYALAWSGLTDAFCSSPITGDAPPLMVLPRAREAVDNAIRSDPALPEVQASLGFFKFWLGWDWAGSEMAQHKAIALDASYAFAHRMLGIVLSHLCRHEEAIASIRRARELDPLSAMNRALSSQIAFAARDLDTALHFAREAVVIDPEFWIGYYQLAQACFHLQKNEQALEYLNQANRLSSGNSKTLSLRGYMLARSNHRADALELLETMKSIAPQRFVPPYAFALIHAGLGEDELALDYLDRAFESHDVHMVFLAVDPKWDRFRDNPRFVRTLKSCGFAEANLPSPVDWAHL